MNYGTDSSNYTCLTFFLCGLRSAGSFLSVDLTPSFFLRQTAHITSLMFLAMSEQLKLKGTLIGHNGWVTQIATTHEQPDMILSASRGKPSFL